MDFFMYVIWPVITFAIGIAMGRLSERIDNIVDRLQALMEPRKQ